VLAPAGWTLRQRAAVRGVALAVLGGLALVACLSVVGRLALAPVDAVDRPPAGLSGGGSLVGGGRFGSEAAGTAAFQDWMARGRVPDPTLPYAAMATTALADLHALTLQNGGVVASFQPRWRYVWPRDSAFAAVALAHTGHLPDAVRALLFLQGVQGYDGSFAARYLPDGSAVADGRSAQEDAPGWALWAVDAVLAAEPEASRDAVGRSLRPLVRSSLSRLVDRTAGPGALPPASSDYWEVRETRLPLGIAAPTLAGLDAGSRLARAWDPRLARTAFVRATTLRHSIELDFGRTAYSRYAGGRGPDAAVTFGLPPYLDTPLDGAVGAARAAVPRLRQPAGGVAPGATWPRHDGVSWTPETALFMLASAETGDTVDATSWLTWLSAHRTSSGSLPEKVRADGRAGSVAPLAWTDALVLLTLDRLDLLDLH
jgi:GH15 family glucan-1,4-alpha-glucosidase